MRADAVGGHVAEVEQRDGQDEETGLDPSASGRVVRDAAGAGRSCGDLALHHLPRIAREQRLCVAPAARVDDLEAFGPIDRDAGRSSTTASAPGPASRPSRRGTAPFRPGPGHTADRETRDVNAPRCGRAELDRIAAAPPPAPHAERLDVARGSARAPRRPSRRTGRRRRRATAPPGRARRCRRTGRGRAAPSSENAGDRHGQEC